MNIDKHLNSLFEFLAIPSISAQSQYSADMKRAATWISKRLSAAGFSSNILPTQGHPVVYAEKIIDQNFPTILIYGHYDVQSPEPLDEWSTNPFMPVVKSGNIYARGVADDKGQLYTWIAAIDELTDLATGPQLNLKFLIEGEEEVGSKNLGEFVRDNKSLLKADICVVSDTHCLSTKQPMIDYGLRGIVYTQVKVKALPKDVHSGIYGGNIANPIQILSQIIAKLKSQDGRILIPEFYEKVRSLDDKEKKELAKLPFGEKQILSETEALILSGEEGYIPAERAGCRPTLDINGIWGGYQGEGPKTIIPAEASAKISMRIVPYQTTKEVFEKFKKYIDAITPPSVESEISLLSSAEAVIVDTENKFFRYADSAYQKVFGAKPLYELSGGTIGVIADFKETLGVDSIMMGYGLPDDGLHSPNEKLSLTMFEKGIETNKEFLKLAGRNKSDS